MKKWRAVEIQVEGSALKEFGLWRIIWGTDIFINNVPFMKCLVVVNLLVWAFLYVSYV